MTFAELKQKLAIEELARTGVGLVSQKTFDEIRAMISRVPLTKAEEEMLAKITSITIEGIELRVSLYMPDGMIYPYDPTVGFKRDKEQEKFRYGST